MDFGPGLTLLTGETGSGKSILVDALGLLLGERASPEMVRTQCELAGVEGVFSLNEKDSYIFKILGEAGIEAEDASLIVRREISAGGRSRIFVNSCLSTLSLLKSIGDRLADIHGQHDRQDLLDLNTHLSWLDRFGKNSEKLREIGTCYGMLREVAGKLDAMRMDEQERLRRMDLLQYQISEIRRTAPRPDEKELLENERNILAHGERIMGLVHEAYGMLYDREPSLLTEANRLLKILQDLEGYDSSWTAHRESLREFLYRLEDLAYSARDYGSKTDFAPGRLDEVEQRLSDLGRLGQKYGTTVDEIIEYCGRCEAELDRLSSYPDTSRSLEEQCAAHSKRYLEMAETLSGKRRADAVRLQSALRREFQSLALEKMELSAKFDKVAPIPGASSSLPAGSGPDGVDKVEFLVSPNKGEDFKPLAKIASGGELSRVMLAIRSICGTGDGIRTLVFDEVDAGIGGRVAEAVGKRLLDLARVHQVLCVTHLPQIAAFAGQHYRVDKSVAQSRTITTVRQLDERERIEELARMLGGEIITDTARRHAREMRSHSSAAAG